jgi:hypothetical protein
MNGGRACGNRNPDPDSEGAAQAVPSAIRYSAPEGSLTGIINRQAEIIRKCEEAIGRLNGSNACLKVEIGQVRQQLRTALDMQLRYQRERDFYRSEKPDLDAELRHQYAEGFQAGRDYIPNRGD